MPLKNNNVGKKVLIISYPFPPIPYSGSYRVVRMCKGLVQRGIEVFVLSINIDKRIPNDYELLDKVPPKVRVFRKNIFDPWLAYQHWYRRKEKTKIVKWLNRVISNLLKLISIPDHQIFWIPTAFMSAKKIVVEYGVDTVLVSSPPISTLLIGHLLKKRLEMRFLADFRDPIIGNIAAVNLIDPKDLLSKIEKRILAKIETIIVRSADAILANTQTHKKELEAKYCIDCVQVVRNAYDEDDYKNDGLKSFEAFTISHLGSIYGLRNADILFAAIKKFEKEHGDNGLSLQILLVGQNAPSIESSIKRYGVTQYVTLKSPVTHKDAITIMARSHVLLLLKASGDGSLGQIPAKFYEYLGARKPVICIGPETSEVAKLIGELNAGFTIENNVEKLTEVIKQLYNDYLSQKSLRLTHPGLDKFTLTTMADQVLELL